MELGLLMSAIKGIIVSGIELARIFGVSPATVRTLSKRGMPIVDSEGHKGGNRYDTAACIQWKRDYDFKKKFPSSGDDSDELSIEEIRRRTELAKMKKEEIELAVQEERFGDVEAILDELANSLSVIRASMIALPKIAPQLEYLESTAIEARLEEEIYLILNELADFATSGDGEDDD